MIPLVLLLQMVVAPVNLIFCDFSAYIPAPLLFLIVLSFPFRLTFPSLLKCEASFDKKEQN